MNGAFVGGIYEAGLDVDGWPGVVTRISDDFGGAKVGLFHLDRLSMYIDVWARDLDPETWSDHSARYRDPRSNPSIRIGLDAPVGGVLDRRQFLDDSGMDKHPIGRDFFAPNRMFHLMFSAVQRDAGSASFLMISRRRDLAPFEPDELSTAAVLADHVGRAMRTHRALRLAGARTLTFERAIERLSSGVVVADAGLKVLHANSAGHATLEADDGVGSRLGRIVLGDLRAQRQLEAAARRLSDPAGGVTDAELEVARPGRLPLRVSVFPAIGDAVVSVASRGQLLILFHDPEAPARSMVELGASVGLTPAETRVAACAAEAASVRQIAETLGLSENTVKTHLKVVYLKTETGSRAELVRWFLQRALGSQGWH